MNRRLGELRAHDGLSGKQCREQRDNCDAPLGGVQKETRGGNVECRRRKAGARHREAARVLGGRREQKEKGKDKREDWKE